MRKFSQVVVEHRSDDSYALLQADITRYIQKVKKSLSVDIQKIIYMTQKYNLTSSTQLDEIRNASKSGLKDLVDKYSIPINDLTSLWAMLKQAKKNIRLLPQYQSETERAEIEAGRLSMDDLTIDLETPQGRNAASKMYMPIVMKIVNDYVGKSKLDKASLMSAGLLAMTNAMNDWKREGKDGEKTVSFKTFLGERVRQQILRDMDTLGHTLSGTNWYATKNTATGLLDAVSLDSTVDGDLDQSKYGALGVEDRPSSDDSKLWDELYKLIEKTFSVRDVDIFYRFFGLNGRKREKSKDIAKSYNMSEGNIRNSVLNKILKFLRKNSKASDILSDIQDIYTEHLMCDMLGMDKQQIIETLASDDTYLLLEDLNRWKSPTLFHNALTKAMSTVKTDMTPMLAGGFNDIDDNLKKSKKDIITFLSNMYPTVNMFNKSDVDLIEYMQELQNAYQKYKLK